MPVLKNTTNLPKFIKKLGPDLMVAFRIVTALIFILFASYNVSEVPSRVLKDFVAYVANRFPLTSAKFQYRFWPRAIKQIIAKLAPGRDKRRWNALQEQIAKWAPSEGSSFEEPRPKCIECAQGCYRSLKWNEMTKFHGCVKFCMSDHNRKSTGD
ncbi:unnamed protein product [Cylicocyclus nassatus]|uniref:Uncharacterized protein n=1 Tax=Cylicocyclus nassatus TaxID=53992 RepID=A0AA36M2V2_CYLNA|nr:unnamed protein product [Cylicocyclus nassatus]